MNSLHLRNESVKRLTRNIFFWFWFWFFYLQILLNGYLRSLYLQYISKIYHCVKSVDIRSYSGLYFPAFGLNTKRYWLNTKRYSVSLRIQSECGKIRIRMTPNTNTFYAVYDKRKCIGSIDKLNMKYFAVLLFPLVKVNFNIFCKWLSYFQFSLNKAWIYQTRVQNKPKNCCINKPINFEWDRLFFEHNQCFAFFHAFKISIIY